MKSLLAFFFLACSACVTSQSTQSKPCGCSGSDHMKQDSSVVCPCDPTAKSCEC